MIVIVGRPRDRVHMVASTYTGRPIVEIDKMDIHPADVTLYVAQLDDAVVVLTNSPYVVDRFRAEQVLVVGKTGKKLLSEHPSFSIWRENLSTGEFWSSVGEAWVDT